MVLEPIYEADFSPYSFGFRPNRCTMDAIKCITWSTQERKKFFWVVEGDISSYFDSICHRKLIKLLRQRIKDRKLLDLIWKFLKAGVMEHKLFRDTQTGVPQGGILSPLLANVYLHQLDQYMEKYTQLPRQERDRRRRQGLGNIVYIRYADDWIALTNGTKTQAEEFKQELSEFLKIRLKLKLSDEKTKITHLNDGFKFLGFVIQRKRGHKGMTTKVEIPKEAVRKVLSQLRTATAASTHSDSVANKVLALNRLYGGWCRYYQYTSRASQTFGQVYAKLFWYLAHWLGGKFRLKMTQVMRRYYNKDGLGSDRYKMMKPLKTQQYQQRFLKPNPYLNQTRLQRERLPNVIERKEVWNGFEARPGMADLRPLVLQRDGYTCQSCGISVPLGQAQVDHKRPVRRFKLPINANRLENLQTLCIPCHGKKTETDRQMESRIR
jgi:RNA-directed DNA polymerase